MSDMVWRSISDGEQEDVLLAVDVDGTARSEATFHDLAPMLGSSGGIRLTMIPDEAATMSAANFVDTWSRDLGAGASKVRTVLGYCAGALFALLLADRVEDTCGVRPEVILFDPERPTPATLHGEFVDGLRAMSSLRPGERDAYSRRASRLMVEHESSFERFVDGLADLYGEACGANLAKLGVARDIAAELEAAFRRYGAYLRCASEIGYADVRWSGATAVVSADAKADGFDCGRVRIDVERKGLLRSEVTAIEVRRLMERGAS